MVDFLKVCVLSKKNMIISGGTGTGKSTILNMLSSFIPNDDRIITVEDTAELRMQQEHVVRLEARPPNIEGHGAITIRDLVKNSLRMRPDRIVVGECRGGEALDMLQAMNTGHDGSLTTIHANSPRDAFTRLETLCLMAGMDLPVWALREQIRSAVHVVVQLTRLQDGSRKVTCITEVTGRSEETILTHDIFRFVQDSVDEQGKVQGHFETTGAIPTFYQDLKAKGLALDLTLFQNNKELRMMIFPASDGPGDRLFFHADGRRTHSGTRRHLPGTLQRPTSAARPANWTNSSSASSRFTSSWASIVARRCWASWPAAG